MLLESAMKRIKCLVEIFPQLPQPIFAALNNLAGDITRQKTVVSSTSPSRLWETQLLHITIDSVLTKILKQRGLRTDALKYAQG